MKKYWQVFKTSWTSNLVYRFNFVMWGIRRLLTLLTIYFLWLAIFSNQENVFGYSRQQIFTYVLGTSLLRTLVYASKSDTVSTEIANGDLNNYLLRPINYLVYWFSQDLADKVLSIFFTIISLGLVILLLKPPLQLIPNLYHLIFFIIAVVLAILMFFLFNFLVSCFAFWYPEHNGWPLRFCVYVVLEFLAGGLFPLDILPRAVFNIFRLLPPAYFLFYPLQIYLGRLSISETTVIISIMAFWLIVLYYLVRLVWQKGLKIYGAYGR